MKTAQKTQSDYTRDAIALFAATIRAERKAQKMTVKELAERSGTSRDFIFRLEKGDPSCGIGAAFEAAHIVGIDLFDMGPSRLSSEIKRVEERLALLPKSIRKSAKVIDDDF